jgi:hypothetical protein
MVRPTRERASGSIEGESCAALYLRARLRGLPTDALVVLIGLGALLVTLASLGILVTQVRRRARVTFGSGELLPMGGPEGPRPTVEWGVVNVGTRPIRMIRTGFDFAHGSRVYVGHSVYGAPARGSEG